jgi:16S rRNA (guanine966-N2)-methyltransferase
MRVVSGRWRGRRLLAPSGEDLRPTTGRVKEAIFSILGRQVEGAEVADLCCGAGGLGIEALSRGAAFVTFVDRAPQALRAAQANLERCGAIAASWSLQGVEAASWLRQRGQGPFPRPFLLLADPPYNSGLVPELLAILAAWPAMARLEAAVLEHRSGTPLEPAMGERWRWRVRRYGLSSLAILEARHA